MPRISKAKRAKLAALGAARAAKLKKSAQAACTDSAHPLAPKPPTVDKNPPTLPRSHRNHLAPCCSQCKSNPAAIVITISTPGLYHFANISQLPAPQAVPLCNTCYDWQRQSAIDSQRAIAAAIEQAREKGRAQQAQQDQARNRNFQLEVSEVCLQLERRRAELECQLERQTQALQHLRYRKEVLAEARFEIEKLQHTVSTLDEAIKQREPYIQDLESKLRGRQAAVSGHGRPG